jgi:hypothetical protein
VSLVQDAPAEAGTAPGSVEAEHTPPVVQAFVVSLLACQAALLIPSIGPLRMFVRMAAFGVSLLLMLVLRGRGKRHPSHPLALLTTLVLLVALANPETINLTAGGAQAGLYIAVFAPLFWVGRLSPNVKVIRQTVLLMWVFHSVSAVLGVLQIYWPGAFMPPVSSIILSKGHGYIESLKITTATGQRVFRPMGLSDIPGGASVSGLYAVLLGSGFFLTRRSLTVLFAAGGSMAAGFACLYLSQVRSILIMTMIALAVVICVLAWRRDLQRLGMLATVALMVVVGGYSVALALAGHTVTRRMSTLTASRPSDVYYNTRGRFFSAAFTETLPHAPFGHGLGHWGMTAAYFSHGYDPYVTWVEIQWAGWIVDGGAPLMVLYFGMLVVALLGAWRVARSPAPPGAPELPFWGAVVLAHGMGALALTFSFPIFLSQPGMEFWLLNALLLAVSASIRRETAEGAIAAPAPGG